MDTSYQELFEKMITRLNEIPYMRMEDLPQIDLYMDQVTTLMEEKLAPTRRTKDDKILTKTMINNYAKNKLLPPPIKKKYSRQHMLLLVFIYYFKGILSLQDIQKLISPLTKDIASGDERFDIEKLYQEISSSQKAHIPHISEDLNAILAASSEKFSDLDELLRGQDAFDMDNEKEYLKVFFIICTLAADVFVKKRIIEELIDSCL